jgi:NAD(P)H-dependent FMN reductase
MKLAVITGSTRPGRATQLQSAWIVKTASAMDNVQVEHVDLADYRLPFFNEPMSPRYNPSREIAPEVQKALDKIKQFDAYVFVTPEYNHSVPGELKNLIDYFTSELSRKPAAVASHGVVGGARAAMHLKEILSEAQAVVIPQHSALVGLIAMGGILDEAGNLAPELASNPQGPQAQLDRTLSELQWYSDALSAARTANV